MTTSRKKELGAFYTPNLVTDVLCNWAINDPNTVLLEPSFGGCNFLVSSINRLSSLGCVNPNNQVYGFDIDPNAFTILKGLGLSGNNFLEKDFLASNPSTFNESVSAVLGNPPYLPINRLDVRYRENILQNIAFDNLKIDRRSSLWVYFIIHSLHYLKRGGKMAWIVPDSISFTKYGKLFLKELPNYFGRVCLLRIKERYFYEAGTHEKTSILLCEDFRNSSSSAEIYQYLSLRTALLQIAANSFRDEFSTDSRNEPTRPGFTNLRLGDVFDIKIGIVIGATKLLTLKTGKVTDSPYYPDYVYPLVSKGKQLEGITINKKRLVKIKNSPAYIIDGVKMERENPTLYSILCNSLPANIKENITFQKRQHLFGYDDYRHPDAFLTYFAQKLPKMIENERRELNSTNSIHRLYLKPEFSKRQDILRFIILQLYCNFWGTHIEALAREYGNSILKFEPSDAAKIPILIPHTFNSLLSESIDNCFSEVKRMIDLGKSEDARKYALTFITKSIDSESSQRKIAV